MKDRILINGVWYVRETGPTLDTSDITECETCTYETDEYCWEASRIKNPEGSFYEDIDIKFTDKRSDPSKEDHWDNNLWFKGVFNGDEESLKEAYDEMDEYGVTIFQLFLKYLINKGWLS